MIRSHTRGGKPRGTPDTQQTPPGRGQVYVGTRSPGPPGLATSCRDLWCSVRRGQSPASTRGHSPLPGAVRLLLPPAVLQAPLQGLPATQDDGPVSTPATQPPATSALSTGSEECACSALKTCGSKLTVQTVQRGHRSRPSNYVGQRRPGHANTGRARRQERPRTGWKSLGTTSGTRAAENHARSNSMEKKLRKQKTLSTGEMRRSLPKKAHTNVQCSRGARDPRLLASLLVIRPRCGWHPRLVSSHQTAAEWTGWPPCHCIP